MIKLKIAFLLLIQFVCLSGFQLQAQQQAKVLELDCEKSIQYLLYLPEDYVEGTSKTFPLMIFLHGGGQVGNDIEKVKDHGPPMLIEKGNQFPFIVVSPQNPYVKGLWDDKQVIQLLDSIITSYAVDTTRIYLTGLSRGGHGVWRTAINNPTRFAAIAPVCGMSLRPYAMWIKDIPIWVFHGMKDNAIPVNESIEMVEKLKKYGADVKITLYPDAEHDAWTETYNNDSLYTWFLEHRLGK